MQEFSAVNPAPGVACFQCTLALDSGAKGCYILLKGTATDETNLPDTGIEIIKTGQTIAEYDHCISDVRIGTYRVLVYDWEDTGLVSDEPAITLESFFINGSISITKPAPSSVLNSPTETNEGLLIEH